MRARHGKSVGHRQEGGRNPCGACVVRGDMSSRPNVGGSAVARWRVSRRGAVRRRPARGDRQSVSRGLRGGEGVAPEICADARRESPPQAEDVSGAAFLHLNGRAQSVGRKKKGAKKPGSVNGDARPGRRSYPLRALRNPSAERSMTASSTAKDRRK